MAINLARPKIATALRLLKSAAFIYFSFLILLYFFQDFLLFHPRPVSSHNEDQYKEFKFDVERDGVKLSGWFDNKPVTKEAPLIVYYGGNGEEVSNSFHLRKKCGNSAALFMNYRGYGHSTGAPSQKNIFEDALFILDKVVKDNNIDLSNVIVYGRSLGSGVAVHVAKHRPIRSVILVTPYDSITNVAQQQYKIFPISWIINHPFDSLSAAKTINKPMLMVVAERDDVIPNSSSQNLYDAWVGPKHEQF